ncbi:MAG: hypothetical protein HW380_1961 [Magnetococcales bacterium]|nr:hypothetical protein [Magnetococcales bacterium]HIJ83231.1 PilZ domain-containing protein [Magnetococcales bacterium]
MSQDKISTPEELYDAMDALTVRTKQGGLGQAWVGLLFETIDRMLRMEPSLGNRGLKDKDRVNQRGNYRVTAKSHGNLVYSGKKMAVEIQDMSAQGFGVHSRSSLPLQANCMLEVVSGYGGKDLYSCFVQNCRHDEGRYRVGLKIFDMQPYF